MTDRLIEEVGVRRVHVRRETDRALVHFYDVADRRCGSMLLDKAGDMTVEAVIEAALGAFRSAVARNGWGRLPVVAFPAGLVVEEEP